MHVWLCVRVSILFFVPSLTGGDGDGILTTTGTAATQAETAGTGTGTLSESAKKVYPERQANTCHTNHTRTRAHVQAYTHAHTTAWHDNVSNARVCVKGGAYVAHD